ncbi:MAG: hypothetical protein JXR07_18220 [Reichenbachiella sp.]
MMKKTTALVPIVMYLLCSCLSPQDINLSNDEAINSIESSLELQKEFLLGKRMIKEIQVSGKIEQKEFVIDSNFFKQELEILHGKKLSQIFQPTAYNKTINGNVIRYDRKIGEKMGPQLLKITKYSSESIRTISIEEYSENLLFSLNKQSSFLFNEERILESYSIESSQKIIGLEASNHFVKGKIIQD